MKRIIDLLVSFFGLLMLSPLIVVVLLIVYVNDFNSPFYRPIRVGKNFKDFRMTKFRTMVINADKIGGTSTSSNDSRITSIGHFIRKYKLDEIIQLWDVLRGKMSLVGPRPQVKDHVENEYTTQEKRLLTVRPGITDFASIVFSDEGDILSESENPDSDYNLLIRPHKSNLGLLYVDSMSVSTDIALVFLTVLAIINKPRALVLLKNILVSKGASDDLIKVAERKNKLVPTHILP